MQMSDGKEILWEVCSAWTIMKLSIHAFGRWTAVKGFVGKGFLHVMIYSYVVLVSTFLEFLDSENWIALHLCRCRMQKICKFRVGLKLKLK